MSTPGISWIRQLAATNTVVSDNNPTITVDASGNTYVAYWTTGIISGGTSYSIENIVLFKLDTDGNLLWLKLAFLAWMITSSEASSKYQISGYSLSESP